MQTASQAKPNEILKHVPALDGIRGLAILLVMLFHLSQANSNTPNHLVNALLTAGGALWVGVDLFFALSGFLITGILIDSLHDAHYFRNFYGRRALRIFPLYYAFLLVLFIGLPSRLADGPRPFVLLLLYLQNTPLWFHLPGQMELANHVTQLWSLAVEEQFYLLWPLVIFLVKDRRRLTWIALAGALAAPMARWYLHAHGATPLETYELTICRADSLLGGAWLALTMRGDARERVVRWAGYCFWAALAGCIWIAIAAGTFKREVDAVTLYGYTLTAIAGAAFVAMSLRRGSVVESAMQNRGLRLLGKYSYCLYIVHQLVASAVETILLPRIRNNLHSLLVYHLLDMAIVLGLSIVIAMLSYRFYEAPILSLKNRFNYDRSGSKARVGIA